MNLQLSPQDSRPAIPTAIAFHEALALLWKANDYAIQTSSSTWDFAVEIDQLRESGLSDNDLRYLIRTQYLEHAREVTAVGQDERRFQPSVSLTFTPSSCFVLAPHVLKIAAETARSAPEGEAIGVQARHVSQTLSVKRRMLMPNWDTDRRMLTWDGRIVKHYRRPADNQVLILSAFQEENWPVRIFNPLAPHPSQDMKRRLNTTITALNRGQRHALLYFRGDGTGEGVLWECATQSR
jgi:hypothetical protein